jgi:hypothetical protein
MNDEQIFLQEKGFHESVQEKSLQKEIDDMIAEIVQHIDGVKEHIKEAGKIYIELLKKDPNVKERFREFNISYAVLNFLERVGRGNILPEFLYTPFQNCKLPISEQQKIAKGTIPMLVIRDGEEDTILVDLLNSPPNVLKQIIPDGRILNIKEQKQYLIAESNKKGVIIEESIWKIVGSAVHIKPSDKVTKITKKELMQMLKLMKE